MPQGDSVNSVQLIGNLGRDPEIRYTQSGKAVCTLRIAVSNGRDKDPEWIDVVCWDKTAELVGQYKRKGDQIAVEGRIQSREWDDKDGNKRRTTEIVAFKVHFIGGKRDDGDSPRAPARQAGGNHGGGYGGGGYSGGGAAKHQTTDDEDIPF